MNMTRLELDQLIGDGSIFSLDLKDLKKGDIVYVATLPHKSGNAALGGELLTNTEETFDYFNSQANKNHKLYKVNIYTYTD